MFPLSVFHVFPLGISCLPSFWVSIDGKWGKELRFEGLAKSEQRPWATHPQAPLTDSHIRYLLSPHMSDSLADVYACQQWAPHECHSAPFSLLRCFARAKECSQSSSGAPSGGCCSAAPGCRSVSFIAKPHFGNRRFSGSLGSL